MLYKFVYYGQIKYCHCHCHCHYPGSKLVFHDFHARYVFGVAETNLFVIIYANGKAQNKLLS